jgi:hypothetical protein
LRRDHDEIGREQGRAHQRGDPRRPVDQDVICVASNFRRLAMQSVARKAENAEEPWYRFLCPLLRPVERRALRICVDDHNALSVVGPSSGEMQRQGRLADAALLVEQCDYQPVTADPAKLSLCSCIHRGPSGAAIAKDGCPLRASEMDARRGEARHAGLSWSRQPGPSADILKMLATTQMFLKKKTAADLRVIISS